MGGCLQGEDGDYYYILDSGHTEVWLSKPPGQIPTTPPPFKNFRKRAVAQIPTWGCACSLFTAARGKAQPARAAGACCRLAISGLQKQDTPLHLGFDISPRVDGG